MTSHHAIIDPRRHDADGKRRGEHQHESRQFHQAREKPSLEGRPSAFADYPKLGLDLVQPIPLGDC